MKMPDELERAIENQIEERDLKLLYSNAQTLSNRYRTKNGSGESLVLNQNEAIAYAVARMPATFGAVSAALNYTLSVTDYKPQTLLDVGAGTGAATWAASELLLFSSITCLERENLMMNIGKALMSKGNDVLRKSNWLDLDLSKANIPCQADLVIASYVLNEMSLELQMKLALELWNASNEILLLVEPGTPEGYQNLLNIRNRLISEGAYIVAPCPHDNKCTIEKGNWCHFSCRIQRSRLHRFLKGGDAPYEDEKFAYMAFARKNTTNINARVLRHPLIYKGYITLEVCTSEGLQKLTFSKKDGERYKKAKKLKVGDEI